MSPLANCTITNNSSNTVSKNNFSTASGKNMENRSYRISVYALLNSKPSKDKKSSCNSDRTSVCQTFALFYRQHQQCKWHRYHNCFTALFPGPPGWAGARRELLDFMVQGKINRGRNTDHL